MKEHAVKTGDRRKSAIQFGVLLGIMIGSIKLLSWLQPQLPAAAVQWLFLLVLPVAAGTVCLMSRSFGGCRELGLVRPVSWWKTLAGGLIAGFGVLLAARFLINPIVVSMFGPLIDPANLDPLKGQLTPLLINVFLVSWIHAALCEEIVFRGFLLRWLERMLGDGATATGIAIVVQGLLFGLSHYPQGPAGIAATALGGILWGAIFIVSRRQLWTVIVGHAAFDTVLFLLVFLGEHRLFLPE